ncbi:hypothetical protein ACQEVC_16550 [Plantactinospora sp. CA-294935]|uniref:hypothetical protein n=1 Tax=Plantactinospora sp. CA-294935 TaxID=3240012 RepID=UPI003D8E7D77
MNTAIDASPSTRRVDRRPGGSTAGSGAVSGRLPAPGWPGRVGDGAQAELGRAVRRQWLLDPERAPSGAQLVEALRTLAATAGPAGSPASDDGPASGAPTTPA